MLSGGFNVGCFAWRQPDFWEKSRDTEKSSAAETKDDVIISIDQMLDLKKKGENVIVLDVRQERALDGSRAKGAVRISPDHAVEDVTAKGFPKETWLIAFCA